MNATGLNTTKDAEARAAVIALVRRGLASPAEAAQLAGVSRQVVNYWIRGMDWRKARAAVLAVAWRRLIKPRQH